MTSSRLQDDDPRNTSRSAFKWAEIKDLEWPSQSRDLNLSEMLTFNSPMCELNQFSNADRVKGHPGDVRESLPVIGSGSGMNTFQVLRV